MSQQVLDPSLLEACVRDVLNITAPRYCQSYNIDTFHYHHVTTGRMIAAAIHLCSVNIARSEHCIVVRLADVENKCTSGTGLN